MRYPDYAIWSFIAFFAVLLPSPWHWRMSNIATICLICWIALANLIIFADVFIWADNFGDHSPIWCDISSRLLQILNYAIPACSLSQMMRLESVASARRSVISAKARAHRMYCEAAMCVGFPLLMMAVLSTIEGHRYDILENIGCRQPQYFSWLTLLLNYALPMAISLAACIYGCLAIRWFLVRRLQFRALLASADSGLNISRYFRLVALGFVEVLVLLASNVVYLILTLKGDDIRPDVDTSWATVHSNYDLISQYTEASSTVDAYSLNVLYIYMTALYSLTFFIFFGMGEEAITEYAKVWMWMSRKLGRDVVRTEAMPATLPSLGSKVVAASGRPWRRPSNPDDDNVLFSEIKGGAHDENPSLNIAVRVEQSIV